MCRILTIAMLAVGCGKLVEFAPSGDEASDADALDAGHPTELGRDGSDGDGRQSCDELASAAQPMFDAIVAAHRKCTVSTECTRLAPPAPCVSACYYVLNRDAASLVTSAATELCSAFQAQGCSLPTLGCPSPRAVACDAGACVFSP
jgi:hypothetical protein